MGHFRLANRAVHLGSVNAHDEKQAIQRAIKETAGDQPAYQTRLIARKTEARRVSVTEKR
jgi:hypothetical protein